MNTYFKPALPHVISILAFTLILFLYFKPAFEGKRIPQNDVAQGIAAGQEITEHRNKTGEEALWSNSMFGGMPMYVVNVIYSGDWTYKVGSTIRAIFPHTVAAIAINFLGAYIMLLCFRVNPYVSGLVALSYAFSVFTILSAEAGHIFKILAMGYMPIVIGGIRLVLSKKYLLGGSLMALAIGLEISAQHYQITYYLAIFAGIYVLVNLIFELKQKNTQHVLFASLALVLASIVGAGPNIARVWSILEYNKYSTRGMKELAVTDQKDVESTQGLDRDYAFSWSQGTWETFTLAIPNLYGGASYEDIGPDSELGKELAGMGVPKRNIEGITAQSPTYWGDQPFTSGPVYAGITILFLAVIGFISIPTKEKVAIGSATVVLTLIAWGRNFESLNYFLFDYLPMFNKFRTVSMSLALTVMGLVLLAGIGLNKFFFDEKANKKELLTTATVYSLSLLLFIAVAQFLFADYQALTIVQKNPSYDIGGIVIKFVFLLLSIGTAYFLGKKETLFGSIKNTPQVKGLVHGIILTGYIVFFIASSNSAVREVAEVVSKDASVFQRMLGQNANASIINNLTSAIQEDRSSMFVSSWFRSLLYLLLVAGVLWAMAANMIKEKIIAIVVLVGIISADLLTVDYNYFDHSKFTERGKFDTKFRKSASDHYILSDSKNDPNYRVFDMNNPFNNSMTSYFHKLVGGYSGLKLQRIQDVIDSTLRQEEYVIKANVQNLQKQQIPIEQIKGEFGSRIMSQLSTLNMLNTKYVMLDSKGTVIKNSNALGNAWFVKEIKKVNSPAEEINAIKKFNPATTAIVDVSKFPDVSDESQSSGKIKLTSYKPNELKYTSSNSSVGVGVFSEIYYSAGWNAYLDGKKTDYFRANYLLRAMEIPAGKHEIVFKFEPKSYVVGNKVSMAFSVVLFCSLGFAVFVEIKKKKNEEVEG